MNVSTGKFIPSYIKICIMLMLTLGLYQCGSNSDINLPLGDPDNGGLFFPDNFEALVVIDSIGLTRHIVVNENGDIYAQLRNSEDGKGTIALRDTDNDGKADSIVHFGDYIDKGRGATGITIHNGYLYVSTKKHVLEPNYTLNFTLKPGIVYAY